MKKHKCKKKYEFIYLLTEFIILFINWIKT